MTMKLIIVNVATAATRRPQVRQWVGTFRNELSGDTETAQFLYLGVQAKVKATPKTVDAGHAVNKTVVKEQNHSWKADGSSASQQVSNFVRKHSLPRSVH